MSKLGVVFNTEKESNDLEAKKRRRNEGKHYDGEKQTAMDTNDVSNRSKPKRRHGRLAHEVAAIGKASVYKARMALEVQKYCPELMDVIIDGKGTLRDAVRLIRELGLHPVKHRKESESESREEQIRRSFNRWLSKWPEDELDAVCALVHEMTGEDFGVETDTETKRLRMNKFHCQTPAAACDGSNKSTQTSPP